MSNPFNGTHGATACPAPFLDSRHFPANGGYTSGRLCGNSAILNATCCLPCPAAQWVYPDSFSSSVQNASKSATLSLICCIFLLLTWILLPSPESHRHYLSVGLTFSVLLLSISFAIPLSTQPQMCYNAITPADMFSSPSCGWSGALFEAGVLASGIWVLLRVLWLHLRVCWGITAGRAFAFGSMFVGFIVPAVFLGISIAVSGFSYQFGSVCFLNRENSFAVFWGWLIAFAIVAFIVQLATSAYTLLIYLQTSKHMRSPGAPPGGGFNPIGDGSPKSERSTFSRSTVLPKNRYSGYSFPKGEWRQTLSRPTSLAHHVGSSPRTPPAPNSEGARFHEVNLERTQLSQKWTGISRVFVAQWRTIVLSMIMAIESIYFATVFWGEDVKLMNVDQSNQAILDFGTCLSLNQGNKNACLQYAAPLTVGKGYVLGTMVIASLMGFQTFLLLSRSSMFTGWWNLLRHPRSSLTDRLSSYNPKPYELSTYNSNSNNDSRMSRPLSTTNDPNNNKLAVPPALSAWTTEARVRADGSMRTASPLQDLEAARAERRLPPIPQSQSPQGQDSKQKIRYSTYFATRASDVPMPPSPISNLAPAAYSFTPMASHTYAAGHQHPEILRIRSPPPPRPPRPWSIQRKPLQPAQMFPETSPTSPRGPEPGWDSQKLRAGAPGPLGASAENNVARNVRSPSPAPDPAAAFRDALRLNPVTSFIAPGTGSKGEKQRETGERKLSSGETSIAPLVPKTSHADETPMSTDHDSFVVGDGSDGASYDGHEWHWLGVREQGIGTSSSVERQMPKPEGVMRRRSKESSPVEEFGESPVDPDRRPSAVPTPQMNEQSALAPTSYPVEEPPPTPGIGRAY